MQQGTIKQEASPDDGDIHPFYPLPPEHAAKARFPQSCAVVHCIRNKLFVVREVGIDFVSLDRSNCYKVGSKGSSRNRDQDSTAIVLREDELVFAPRTSVWVSVAGAEKRKGITLGASHDPEGLESLCYTVQALGETNQSIIYDNILPQALQYRPKVKHTEPEKTWSRLSSSKHVGQPEPPSFVSLNIPSSNQTTTLSGSSSEPSAAAPAAASKENLKNQSSIVATPPRTPRTNTRFKPRITMERLGDSPEDQICLNPHPNPFQRIKVGPGHAQWNLFYKEYVTALGGLCFRYHLKGVCRNGEHCKYGSSHRQLTSAEASDIEQCLSNILGPDGWTTAPQTSAERSTKPAQRLMPDGPAINKQENPFSKLKVSRDLKVGALVNNMKQYYKTDRVGTMLGMCCLHFHLRGICEKSASCPFYHTHENLRPKQAKRLEEKLWPFFANFRKGDLFIARDAPSGPLTSSVSSTKRHLDDTATPLFQNGQNKRQRIDQRYSTRFHLERIGLQVGFIIDTLLSKNVLDFFRNLHGCALSLGGNYDMRKKERPVHLPFTMYLQIDGSSEENVSKCLHGVREHMLREIGPQLHAHLYYRLALRNRCLGSKNIGVIKADFPVHLFDHGLEYSLSITVLYGMIPEGKKRMLEDNFPSCYVQIIHGYPEHPRIGAFVLIAGQQHESVLRCRGSAENLLKQAAENLSR